MTVAISIERYLGICHPNLQFSRRSWIFIIPVIIITVWFSFPSFLQSGLYFVNRRFGVGIMFRLWDIKYYVWGRVVLRKIIPQVALLFFNGLTGATIYKRTNYIR